jgi:anhydro-N-acetylmuramic acid kinase
MDGIDATIINTNGKKFVRTGYNFSKRYKTSTKKLLEESINNPINFSNKKLKTLNNLITLEHAIVIKKLVNKFLKNKKEPPIIIGFHGQTIYHNSSKRISVQLGNPKLLAQLTGINVVFDLRKNDIKNGGEGAPLAPIYHQSMMKELNQELPAAILNLGGVGNITWYNGKSLIGFDTGPGNGLMDTYIQKKICKPFDMNGESARKGIPSIRVIKSFLEHGFFDKSFPKSLDRLTFCSILNNKDFIKLGLNDALSTLVELTVESLKKSIMLLPSRPLSLLIVGGGQNNIYLVETIKKTFNFNVLTAKDIGLDGEFIEAELMAFIAVRSMRHLPITFPKTTGVRKPTTGGVMYFVK